jgi:hypothetical protein
MAKSKRAGKSKTAAKRATPSKSKKLAQLRTHLVSTRELLNSYSPHPAVGVYLASVGEALGPYLKYLASTDIPVTLTQLKSIGSLAARSHEAHLAGNLDDLLSNTRYLISALPGDPTTLPRRPRISALPGDSTTWPRRLRISALSGDSTTGPRRPIPETSPQFPKIASIAALGPKGTR